VKICQQCGKEFISKAWNVKYCLNCRRQVKSKQENTRYQRKRKSYSILCAVCSNQFDSFFQRQKTCSLECKKKYRRLYYRRNKVKMDSYYKKEYHDNINHRVACVLRARLNSAIKNNQKTGSAVQDLGCTIAHFKAYLESKFTNGMSWNNWAKDGWHIDHIKPLVSFDLSNREELLKACHYTNLQPLWAQDNLSKGKKIQRTKE